MESLKKLFWIVEATHELRKSKGGYVSATTLFEGAHSALQILKPFNPVLLGGFVIGYYAEPRATHDFDITVATDRLPEVASELKKNGFVQTGINDFKGINIHHFERGGFKLDVLQFQSKEFQKDILDHAQSQDFLGVQISIIAPEELIATKLLSFRPKDKIDILSLLEKKDLHLDFGRIKAAAQLLKIFDRYAFIEENLPK
jgi:DNA-directed RNA polymerase subunit F